jgi:replicative DNA helicase
MSNISSLKIERHVLGGLIKHPNVFFDVDRFIDASDFVSKEHYIIYSTIKDILSSGKKLDKTLLAHQIKNLGVSFKNEVDIFNYIEDISFTQINKSAVVEACQELCKIRIRRDIDGTADKLKTFVKTNGHRDADSIISEADQIYNEKIQNYSKLNEPEDLFGGIEDLIQERANDPKEEMGLKTPYRNFNRMFGGIRKGNIYAWVSRPKHGKSTILSHLATRMSVMNNCPALILDTEMTTVDVQFRIASSATGISVWHLETGMWKKDEEMVKKFNENKDKLKLAQEKVKHMTVAGKPIEEICSIIRRWYYSEVGRGNDCVVVYDYIKLTGEKDFNKKEYELIGEKVNSLKELTLELDIPLLTACQLNRSAESGNDDSSAIAQSDRLQWFASFVAIFRRKTPEEISQEGPEFGTHKLIPLATRFQGREAQGHHDLVRVAEGNRYKYVPNFINYSIDNFQVTENGTLENMVEAGALQATLNDEEPNRSELL